MAAAPQRIRLVVPPSIGAARARVLASWLRALVPAAVLVLTAPGALPDADGDDTPDTISIDADAVPSGPLSLADALARSGRR